MKRITELLKRLYDNNIINIEFMEWNVRDNNFIFTLKVKDHDDEILTIDDDIVINEINKIIATDTIEVRITL